MPAVSEIMPVKEKVEESLINRKGVTAVGIGYKIVGGQKTDELAIRVFVAEKKPEDQLTKSQIIPKTVQGIKTDVVQYKFAPFPLRARVEEIQLMVDASRYDPLRGGMSIGPCRAIGGFIYVGTLGMVVQDNATGNPMLLSNFHVMCVDDTWSVGDQMAQPSRVDGGRCPADEVGTLQRAVLAGTTAGGGPGVDCAVSSFTARGQSCEIIDIGEIAGSGTAVLDMAVRKRGRTTGLTHGIVDTIDLTVRVDYEDGLGVVTLEHQIGINVNSTESTVFGRGGDSGSVVVDEGRRVVGLYFAGNIEERNPDGTVSVPEGVYGIANPIAAVLSALNVSLCSPKLKELKEKEVFKDFKDGTKEIFKDLKDKELKDRIKEWKEPKELKEKPEPKEFKEFKEKPEKENWEGFPGLPQEIRPPGFAGGFEQRLARLEAAVASAAQFAAKPQLTDCIDFQTFPPMTAPNPWTVGWLNLVALDHAGNPWPNPRIASQSGFIGLDCGYRLEIGLASPCSMLELTLVHFARPATATAYDAAGAVVASAAMSGPQRVAETLILSGPNMARVIVEAPSNETFLLKVCCIEKPVLLDKPSKEPLKEGKEKPEPKEFKEPFKEFKEPKEFKEKPEPKELKEPLKEFKEKPEPKELKEPFKELKEKPEPKELVEGFPRDPLQSIPPSSMGSLEERLARLEAAIAQMSHFIKSEVRPDLNTGALRQEPDLSSADLDALSQQLRKQARDSKDAKDSKDMEKPRER